MRVTGLRGEVDFVPSFEGSTDDIPVPKLLCADSLPAGAAPALSSTDGKEDFPSSFEGGTDDISVPLLVCADSLPGGAADGLSAAPGWVATVKGACPSVDWLSDGCMIDSLAKKGNEDESPAPPASSSKAQ